MSEQKPSHEVKGIVRRALRQDCVKAQIWGRVAKNKVCIIEGPITYSAFGKIFRPIYFSTFCYITALFKNVLNKTVDRHKPVYVQLTVHVSAKTKP